MRFLLLAAFFTVAAPAMAQDGSETAEKRTVEGAQKFLADFFERKTADAEMAGYLSGTSWSWAEAPGHQFQMVRGDVVGMRATGRCKSTIALSNLIKKQWRNSDARIPIQLSSERIEKELDWSKLASFKVADGWVFEEGGPNTVPSGSVEVRLYFNNGHVFLQHNDKAEAERIGFAAQFLKDECGFKSETGF